MNRTLSRLAYVALAAVALFAVACGGGGGGGIGGLGGGGIVGPNFNKDPVNFARAYYYLGFRIFSGDTMAADMLKLFEESCRTKVAVADVDKGLEKAREEFSKLKGAKIEDVDFQGKAKVTKTDKGATVVIPSANDSRVKVDGKWLNAFDYFKAAGLVDDSDKDDTEDLELVLVSGRYYDADCSNLTDIADTGKRANATPTPARSTPARSTPTPARTTPTATAGSRTPTPSRGATGNITNADVEAHTKRYLLMLVGAFSGQTRASDVLEFFTSDCRARVTAANVTTGLNKAATTYPKMKGDRIEDLDFGGKLKITPTSKGFDVLIPGSREMRIKVNGQFVGLRTYALNAGIEDSTDTGNETTEQSFIVEGGKLYDADCDFLQGMASTR